MLHDDVRLVVAARISCDPHKAGWLRKKAMSQTRTDSIAELLSRSEAATEVLGRIFARAFATYTVEVLTLLEGKGVPLERVNQAGAAEVFGDDAFAGAPAWVKEAYERTKHTKEVVKPNGEEVRSRIIRNKLAQALQQRGMTQSQLAKQMGKSPAVISRIFRSPERSRLRTLQGIAEALDVDVTDIL